MKKSLVFIYSLLCCALPLICNAQNRPGTCNIKGQIVSIIKAGGSDKSDPCSKHPCRAKVKIIESGDCGSSVSLPHGAGDIIELQFAYTLDNTAKIYPKMKEQFPGLKKGDSFTASIEQRLKPGSEGEFVVFAYQKINAGRGALPHHKPRAAAGHSVHRP